MSCQPSSPWQQRPDAARLRSWNDRQLARIAAVVDAAMRGWAKDWDLAGGLDASACEAASAGPATMSAWGALDDGSSAGAWIAWKDGSEASLAEAFFGRHAHMSPATAAVVKACRTDAQKRLAESLRLDSGTQGLPAAPSPAAWMRWSGAVHLALPYRGSLLLEAELVARVVAEPSPAIADRSCESLVPLPQALAPVSLPLQVALEGCELGVGELLGLQAGDVLRLAHRVDAPAVVRDGAGRTMFGGWLAASSGRLAVELAPAAST